MFSRKSLKDLKYIYGVQASRTTSVLFPQNLIDPSWLSHSVTRLTMASATAAAAVSATFGHCQFNNISSLKANSSFQPGSLATPTTKVEIAVSCR